MGTQTVTFEFEGLSEEQKQKAFECLEEAARRVGGRLIRRGEEEGEDSVPTMRFKICQGEDELGETSD